MALSVTALVRLSFICNVGLIILKATAAGMSGSLAVIASLVDSILDVASQLLFMLSEKAARTNSSWLAYPVGKARFEPVTVLVFASVMGSASLSLIKEGVQQLIAHTDSNLTFAVIASTAAVVIVKLLLFVLCRASSDMSVTLSALADDHRNDVLSNSVVFTAILLISQWPALWWLDGTVAICTAFLIGMSWGGVALETFRKLAGKAPSVQELNIITQAVWDFCRDQIIAIDTIRAYHSGERLFAEVDIVLPEDTPLKQSHDLAESLQVHLETNVDAIERAFIHVDYETNHRHLDEHPGVAPDGWLATPIRQASDVCVEMTGGALLAAESVESPQVDVDGTD